MIGCLRSRLRVKGESYSLVEFHLFAHTCGSFFLTGSYDSNIRLFNENQELVLTLSGHTGPVTDTAWVSSNSDNSRILSSSYDTTARISEVVDGSARALASLHLHSGPVSSIKGNSKGTAYITASWDGLVGIWNSDIPEEDQVPLEANSKEPSRKKRKTTSMTTVANETIRRKAPVGVLKSHTGRVSKAIFDSNVDTKGFSCGWDFSIRSWDIDAGVCVSTVVCEHPFRENSAILES
jgi:ribosome biogenesis protein